MRPLHVLNQLRQGRVQALAEAHFGRAPGAGLGGLRVLDVGCGAGLLCEPLARAGAAVTGIDAAARSIAIARDHAAAGALSIDYRAGDPAQALQAGEQFDVLLLLEVVEHVQDVPAFVHSALAHLAPGGLVVVSTINRTWRSFAVAIVGAEWVLRLLPRGTHRWADFVTPAELAQAMAAVKQISQWKVADLGESDLTAKIKTEFRFRLDLSQVPRPFQIGAIGQSEWDINASARTPLRTEGLR
jgi:2-polyprenyl-6-hydroxyphenyl methylase/3-demethylubiquinone-9 3-methyltransferase